MIPLDGPARARLVDRFGPQVERWCTALPAMVSSLAERWNLEVRSAIAGGTGRTLMCRDDAGRSVVLKLTPQLDIAATEAMALRAWAGCSRVVELIDTDYQSGALLLEGVVPGRPLREMAGNAPVGQVADLLVQLRSASPPDGIPALAERVADMFELAERRRRGSPAEEHLPVGLMRRSRALCAELAADGPRSLVHGDLHPGNVLQGGRGIVAIDPRPCVGDPTFDAVDWAFLPVADGGAVEDGIATLVERLPELDTDRLRKWCSGLAVLMALAPLRSHAPTAYTAALLRMAP